MDKIAFFYNLGYTTAMEKIAEKQKSAPEKPESAKTQAIQGAIGHGLLGGLTGLGLGALTGQPLAVVPMTLSGLLSGAALGGGPALLSERHPYLATAGLGALIGGPTLGLMGARHGLGTALTSGLVGSLAGAGLFPLARAPGQLLGKAIYKPKKSKLEALKERLGID